MTTSQITLDTPNSQTPTTRYPSVAAWAAALGSKAKTRAGQRKAIIAAFDKPVGGRIFHNGNFKPVFGEYVNGIYVQRSNKADYLAKVTRANQERFAASHPLTLSHPAPATRQDVEGDSSAPTVSVLELQDSRYGKAWAGGFCVRTREEVSWDNNYYSKSYNSKYGGKKSVDARTVLIRRVKTDGTLESRDVEVSAWRGNYLLDALIEAGVVKAHKGLMNIRLHSAYDVQIVREAAALKIYERTLGGGHVDFCAVRAGVTFHAPTQKAAVKGLREKVSAKRLRAQGKLISYALGKKLNFCDEGMRAFARAFDLEIGGEYTPEEIAAAVKQNVPAALSFRAELTTLAETVGYKLPEGW